MLRAKRLFQIILISLPLFIAFTNCAKTDLSEGIEDSSFGIDTNTQSLSNDHDQSQTVDSDTSFAMPDRPEGDLDEFATHDGLSNHVSVAFNPNALSAAHAVTADFEHVAEYPTLSVLGLGIEARNSEINSIGKAVELHNWS